MQVFVTGGTGTIGSAVVSELLNAGHSVLALARSDASAQRLRDAGAETVRGSIADLEVLRESASRSDGVISLAFSPSYGTPDGLAKAIEEESAAVGVLGESLVGSDRPMVAVSGTPWVAGRAATEDDPLPTQGPVAGRAQTVNALLELSARGVRASAVRMPRTVHNQGKGGFAGLLTEQARRSGVSGYPADGTQRWPAVHALDAALLFRLALESAPAGTAWHAVADEGDAVLDIATVIGRRLALPVESVTPDTFGPFGPIFAMDQPATSLKTRESLGWRPVHLSLLEDLENIQP